MIAGPRLAALLVMAATAGIAGSVLAKTGGSLVPPAGTMTTKSGIYTVEQASRGMTLYIRNCSACHGEMFNGSESGPPLDGTLIDRWKGKALAELLAKMKTTMPPLPDSKLPDRDYVDIIAQILLLAGEPAGETELSAHAETLAAIPIE